MTDLNTFSALRHRKRPLMRPLPLRERARQTFSELLMGEGARPRGSSPSPISIRGDASPPSPAGGEGTTTSTICASTLHVISLLVLTTLFPPSLARAQDFYKGKTITIICGYGVGGGYDAYARLLARHLGSHIPGQPTVIVQNVP